MLGVSALRFTFQFLEFELQRGPSKFDAHPSRVDLALLWLWFSGPDALFGPQVKRC